MPSRIWRITVAGFLGGTVAGWLVGLLRVPGAQPTAGRAPGRPSPTGTAGQGG